MHDKYTVNVQKALHEKKGKQSQKGTLDIIQDI